MVLKKYQCTDVLEGLSQKNSILPMQFENMELINELIFAMGFKHRKLSQGW